jgi:4-amino-4-deoxy-L-arabinose transferase
MRSSIFAVSVLFLLLYILPLGARPVVIPDEARYAEIPREMLASGDWVVPRLNGLRYFEKPVLGYWLNALSMALFGQNAFAMRLPSAASTGLSALLLFLLVRRYGGGRQPAILASVIFLTFLEVFALGVFNVLDSLFSMFVTVAMAMFFLAYTKSDSASRPGFLALSGLCGGLAFLTKGFPAFAVMGVAIAPFLIWERRVKEILRVPWIPIAAALAVALPWSIMIYLREPDFWHHFFWVEHIGRFTSETPQHPRPFWYFIPVMAAGAVPWAAFIPAAISGLRDKALKGPFLRFALCWFLFPFLFFSASSGKIATYILPCFPALAVLIALGLDRYVRQNKTGAFTGGAWALAAGTALVAVALTLSQLTDFPGIGPYSPSETWKWLVGVAGLIVWSGISAAAAKTRDSTRKVALCCIAPVLFLLSAQFLMPDRSIERKAPGAFLVQQQDKVGPDTLVLSTDDPVRAVCWFYKRADVFLIGDPGELTYGIHYPDSRSRLLTLDQFRELIHENRGKKRVVFITRTDAYDHYRRQVPAPSFEIKNSRFVFAQY